MRKPSRIRSIAGPRAIVIGISDYAEPIPKLPAVAADVKEIARLLGSRRAAFSADGVVTLTDKRATRKNILDGLKNALAEAAEEDVVFVYIAGHGGVHAADYYFVAHDTDAANLGATGVPLAEIKKAFDRSASRRVFLWLDFCHSGGILARNAQSDDASAIRRVLEVVKGEGKVILAACTPSESAYECPTLGHGLFTHALLEGLRGKALNAQGEVTPLSLYEYIDHQVSGPRQRPVFFGQMTGRIVLVHRENRKSTPARRKEIVSTRPTRRPKQAGTWMMLGDSFLLASRVRHASDGKLEVSIIAASGDEEAVLASLRPGQFSGRHSMPFAYGNEGGLARVENVESHVADGKQVWTLGLTIEPGVPGCGLMEVSANGIGPDEIARRRTGRILLNDPPPSESRRGFGSESLIDSLIEGAAGKYPVRECVVRAVYRQYSQLHHWKEIARLKAVFLLKITGSVEHVLELAIGKASSRQVAVTFRGRRRQQFSNVPAQTIEIRGNCPLQ